MPLFTWQACSSMSLIISQEVYNPVWQPLKPTISFSTRPLPSSPIAIIAYCQVPIAPGSGEAVVFRRICSSMPSLGIEPTTQSTSQTPYPQRHETHLWHRMKQLFNITLLFHSQNFTSYIFHLGWSYNHPESSRRPSGMTFGTGWSNAQVDQCQGS